MFLLPTTLIAALFCLGGSIVTTTRALLFAYAGTSLFSRFIGRFVLGTILSTILTVLGKRPAKSEPTWADEQLTKTGSLHNLSAFGISASGSNSLRLTKPNQDQSQLWRPTKNPRTALKAGHYVPNHGYTTRQRSGV